MQIAILHQEIDPAAPADEADVLVQVEAVAQALDELGHGVTVVACGLDLVVVGGRLERLAPDVAFNLVEGLGGEGARIAEVPRLLEGLQIAFTGAGAEAMRLTSSKLLAKEIMVAADLPTPSLHRPGATGLYIVKSEWEHASIGLDAGSVVAADRVEATITEREARFGGRFFAERYVPGREINLALLDHPPEPLPAAEIAFSGFGEGEARIVSYAAKWDPASRDYERTPPRPVPAADGELVARLSELALSAWRLFNLSGYARVDFRVDEGGAPFILEINANPCLSPEAGFALAVERAGMTPAEAVARILAAASRRYEEGRCS